MRRSTKVALILLGTAGVVGAAVVWDAWQRSRDDASVSPTGAAQPAPEPVSAERTYQNNTYLPGAGYYHAPFYGFFPFPLNHYDPARGYFSGGQWRASQFASDVTQSQPTAAAAASALAAQRAAREQQQRAQSSSFFRGGSSGNSSSTFSSRPSTAPSSKPSVIRGGFGSSSRGASGASGGAS